MRSLFISFIILLCASSVLAQSDTSNSNLFDKATLSLGGGIFMPQGNLSTYFGTAPFFEISGHLPLKRKKAIGMTLQVVVPNQKDDFLYRRTIDTIQVKSTMMLNFTVDFKKTLTETNTSILDVKIGVGASAITTDARNPFYSGEEGEEKYETITAILFSPGFEYTHTFNKGTKFIIGMSLNYAPYKVEGAVRENIGGLALVPKITYIF
ncbi:hypothetical protein [Kordia zhangzhouensis]|uniref:hypothetical protein n=1 Tax=Kordia zhangzhouensis TaxID=1620405 RepID=UPI0012F9077B|nr:hypothetical protein [Kordia zhangzhouensis]